MAKSDLKTASVLAFERKLDPSDALFAAGNWKDIGSDGQWRAVNLIEKSVRGTISNRLKASEQDPAKLDAKIDVPNLQKVDVAMLPGNADTLRVSFTLRVHGGVGAPSACNSPAYEEKLRGIVSGYANEVGFEELAKRYAYNLANGRFLWRNRLGAESVQVEVRRMVEGEARNTWIFDALSFSLRAAISDDAKVGELASVIQDGLAGNANVLLDITAYVRVGRGQEVFPSQELILDGGSSNAKGKKSKTLYAVGDVAAMHSQKIGNALRTIDTWYPGEGELGPIAVEPYGSVTSQGRAYRQPKDKADFYNLLDGWMLKNKEPSKDDQHFVMAVLVRGGVFGEAEKE